VAHGLADGLAVCGNGAIVYDLAQGTIVAQRDLPAAVAQVSIAELRAAISGIAFAIEAWMRYGEEPVYAPIERDPTDGSCGSPMRSRSTTREWRS
jgi:hypothetical protein